MSEYVVLDLPRFLDLLYLRILPLLYLLPNILSHLINSPLAKRPRVARDQQDSRSASVSRGNICHVAVNQFHWYYSAYVESSRLTVTIATPGCFVVSSYMSTKKWFNIHDEAAYHPDYLLLRERMLTTSLFTVSRYLDSSNISFRR